MQPIHNTDINDSTASSASPTALPHRRKRTRQPTSLSHNTLTPPTGLRYPTQLLYAARTGHTSLLNINQLHAQFVAFRLELDSRLAALPRPPPPPPLDDVRLQTPYRLIAERMETEVAAVGEWMKEKESEVNSEQQRRAEEQEKEWEEQKRKEREERAARRRRDRQAKATNTEAKEERRDEEAVKDERKEVEEQSIAAAALQPNAAGERAMQEERTEIKDADGGETVADGQASGESESKSVRRPTPKRPRRAARTFSASLSSPSTATSALQLSAGVDLPPSFGASLPSHSDLMAALLPDKALAALPLSLFPPVIDFNSLTPELFLHRLQKRLGDGSADESKADAPTTLPPGTALLRVSVYASASERKQQEVIVHGEQTLDELMAVIRCSNKQQPTRPQTTSSSLPGLSTPPDAAATEPAVNTEFLYIENTLYPTASTPVPTLQPVLDFLTTHSDTAPLYPPTISPAHSTTFLSLSVRLASHYLYHHSVDCCHTLTVDGIDFLDEVQHVADRRAYPLVVYERSDRRRLCGGCRMASAVCCVYGDMLSDVEPLLLCDGCERLLHCDNQANRLYDNFTMYRL